MSTRTFRLLARPSNLLALLLILAPASPIRAHGGHGGAQGGGNHAASSHHHGGSSGGGGSSRNSNTGTTQTPFVFNPYDLPAARLNRYVQHLFHLDRPAHP